MSIVDRLKPNPPTLPKKPNTAVVPEDYDDLKLIVNQAQAVLVARYGLSDLSLEPASYFLYPDASSSIIEENLRIKRWADAGFFVTDADSEEERRLAGVRIAQRKQILRQSLSLPLDPYVDRIADQGTRFPDAVEFADLHPVIYVSPELVDKTRGIQHYSEMFTPESYRALEVITEETGHFIYSQAQWKLHQEMPGGIMAEGIALVDGLQIIQAACQRLGQDFFTPTDPQLKYAIGQFLEKIRYRYKIHDRITKVGAYCPNARTYSRSVGIISGLLRHNLARESQDEDTSLEMQRFYRLTGPEKGRYLKTLYQGHLRNNDNFYREPLSAVEDALEHEPEFEDEVFWRDRWNRLPSGFNFF